MRIARGLASHRAQAKTLVRAEIGGLQAAIVEHQRFALAVFEEQFAIVGALDRVGDDLLEAALRHVKLVDQGCAHFTVSRGSISDKHFVATIQRAPK